MARTRANSTAEDLRAQGTVASVLAAIGELPSQGELPTVNEEIESEHKSGVESAPVRSTRLSIDSSSDDETEEFVSEEGESSKQVRSPVQVTPSDVPGSPVAVEAGERGDAEQIASSSEPRAESPKMEARSPVVGEASDGKSPVGQGSPYMDALLRSRVAASAEVEREGDAEQIASSSEPRAESPKMEARSPVVGEASDGKSPVGQGSPYMDPLLRSRVAASAEVEREGDAELEPVTPKSGEESPKMGASSPVAELPIAPERASIEGRCGKLLGSVFSKVPEIKGLDIISIMVSSAYLAAEFNNSKDAMFAVRGGVIVGTALTFIAGLSGAINANQGAFLMTVPATIITATAASNYITPAIVCGIMVVGHIASVLLERHYQDKNKDRQEVAIAA